MTQQRDQGIMLPLLIKILCLALNGKCRSPLVGKVNQLCHQKQRNYNAFLCQSGNYLSTEEGACKFSIFFCGLHSEQSALTKPLSLPYFINCSVFRPFIKPIVGGTMEMKSTSRCITTVMCWLMLMWEVPTNLLYIYSWPPLWSSGQSFWLQIQRFGFVSRLYHIFWEVVGLERGPLSLVSTTEKLLGRIIAALVWKIEITAVRDPLTTWHPSTRESWH
jgi:hypothetical protein